MKSLKEFVEAKKLNEAWMPDSKLAAWLKEYWNEIVKSERDSLIDVDKVIWDAEKELNIDLRKNKKELTDYLKRTWGKSVLKEAVSTTSKKEIARKADAAIAGWIHDLKAANDDMKNGDYEWAGYRMGGVADAIKKLQPALKEWGGLQKAGKLTEATSNLREGFGELEVYTSFGPGLGIQIYPSRRGGGMAELTAHVGYVSKGSANDTRKKELKSETEITAIDEIKVSDLKQIEKVVKKHLDALDSELEKTFKQLGYK